MNNINKPIHPYPKPSVSGYGLLGNEVKYIKNTGKTMKKLLLLMFLLLVNLVLAVPNQASVFCEDNEGKIELRASPDGSQGGYCIFKDGSECEEWAFFNKLCIPDFIKKREISITTGYGNKAMNILIQPNGILNKELIIYSKGFMQRQEQISCEGYACNYIVFEPKEILLRANIEAKEEINLNIRSPEDNSIYNAKIIVGDDYVRVTLRKSYLAYIQSTAVILSILGIIIFIGAGIILIKKIK